MKKIGADETTDPKEAEIAFTAFLPKTLWLNGYQLYQTMNHVASMCDFTTYESGYKILCACGMNHKRAKAK